MYTGIFTRYCGGRFQGIISDLFPGVDRPEADYKEFTEAAQVLCGTRSPTSVTRPTCSTRCDRGDSRALTVRAGVGVCCGVGVLHGVRLAADGDVPEEAGGDVRDAAGAARVYDGRPPLLG